MVGDKEVIGILLRKLLEPQFRDGALLDGFPGPRCRWSASSCWSRRSTSFIIEFANTTLAIHFRRPTIHVMVLFVTERTSIERQIKRGLQLAALNKEVEETGVGKAVELRPTDLSEETARRRYRVFKEQTWDALQSLRGIYHYHFVNAEGPIEEVEENILEELKYQSSLELDPRTLRPAQPAAAGGGDHPARPAGAGQATGQLRAGAHRAVHSHGEGHRREVHSDREAACAVRPGDREHGRPAVRGSAGP